MNIALFICQHPSHVFGGELLEQMASLTQICYRNVNIVQNEVKDYIICTYDKRDMGNVNSNQMDPHCQSNLQTVVCEIQVHSLRRIFVCGGGNHHALEECSASAASLDPPAQGHCVSTTTCGFLYQLNV